MKFLTVFAAVLALAAGALNPASTWTLQEIDQALSDSNTDPAQIPYLINALNTIMANLISGVQQNSVILSLPMTATVTLREVTTALEDPRTDPAVIPYYEAALNEIMEALFSGENKHTTILSIPAMNVNVWSLNQLSHAIQDPATDPELKVYIEHGLNMLMEQIFAGGSATSIAIVTPPGVSVEIPILPEPAIPIKPSPTPSELVPALPEPTPVHPEPINPMPVIPAPVVPEAPVATAPLVQLIINVNTNQASVPAEAPEAVEAPVAPVAPTPVHVAGYEPAVIDSIPEPIIAVGPWA